MTAENDNSRALPLAGPAHEAGDGIVPPGDARRWDDVRRWRRAQRERLIAARLALPQAERGAASVRAAAEIESFIGDPGGMVVSLYWPFRGEHDLRGLLAALRQRGAETALPVVATRAAPLEFRSYAPGDPLERGIWNIPVPTNRIELFPDVVIAPLVGFDPQGYRLGYGGGYYDRTLAALPRKPLVIGVGYTFARLGSICPQPHDIAMDRLVLT